MRWHGADAPATRKSAEELKAIGDRFFRSHVSGVVVANVRTNDISLFRRADGTAEVLDRTSPPREDSPARGILHDLSAEAARALFRPARAVSPPPPVLYRADIADGGMRVLPRGVAGLESYVSVVNESGAAVDVEVRGGMVKLTCKRPEPWPQDVSTGALMSFTLDGVSYKNLRVTGRTLTTVFARGAETHTLTLNLSPEPKP